MTICNPCAESSPSVDLTGQTDGISIFIETPVVEDYLVGLNMPFGGLISHLTLKTESGTGTMSVKINDVIVTGLSAIAASTTQLEAIPTALNTFEPGDDIHLVVDSVSSLLNLAASIAYRRT